MRRVLVTGSDGFVGRNLCLALTRRGDVEVIRFVRGDELEDLGSRLQGVEQVFHLAGVNRPKEEDEFVSGNTQLTAKLCQALRSCGRPIPIAFTSSSQAELDNAYGRSKQAAEEALLTYHRETQSPVTIYRFPNLFGKWSRPHYNTVVATFSYNICRDLPVRIDDKRASIRFIYIDDVVKILLETMERPVSNGVEICSDFAATETITLGELHELLISFRQMRADYSLPDLSKRLTKSLYSTYLSFCPADKLAYPVSLKHDDRGWLFELTKSRQAGQIFVSRTRPGITRGNHYHDSKVEKFCVVQGAGCIRLRHLLSNELVEYQVNDGEIQIVDIPPGFTHSIENVGTTDMITLFWANEIFDPARPDTFPALV